MVKPTVGLIISVMAGIITGYSCYNEIKKSAKEVKRQYMAAKNSSSSSVDEK